MDLGAWEDGEVIWRDKDEKFIFKPQYDWNECFISFSISNCNRKKYLLARREPCCWWFGLLECLGFSDSVACSHPNHSVLGVLLIVKVTPYVCNYT